MNITCCDSRSPCVVSYRMRPFFGYGFFTLIFIEIYIYIYSGLVPGLICMMDGNSSNTPTDDKSCPSVIRSGSNTPRGNKANTTSSNNIISSYTSDKPAADIGNRKNHPILQIRMEKFNKQSLSDTITN